MPAVKVAGGGELIRPGGFEFDAGALFDFRARPVHAAFGDDVFQPRMLAVGAVAEIAMNRQHGLRHVHELVRREKPDDIRQAGIGRSLPWLRPMPPPTAML